MEYFALEFDFTFGKLIQYIIELSKYMLRRSDVLNKTLAKSVSIQFRY